jgi:hypothetical protein
LTEFLRNVSNAEDASKRRNTPRKLLKKLKRHKMKLTANLMVVRSNSRSNPKRPQNFVYSKLSKKLISHNREKKSRKLKMKRKKSETRVLLISNLKKMLQ